MKFEVSALQNILSKEKFDFISSFLSHCPKEILDQMELCYFKENHVLMHTGDQSEIVYILLKGAIDGVDENVPNIPYTFTELVPIDVVGDYELFSDSVGRYVTLQTTKPTTCIKISAHYYLSWIKQDNHMLFLRMQMLMRVLGLETQFHRQYLFLDNETRLVLFLTEECSKNARRYPHTVNADRERIASRIGCSIRTLNRTISVLEKKGYIDRQHGKIVIQKEQRQKLKLFIKEREASILLTLPKS